MPDGSNPPEPPVIQRVCGGLSQTVAYCDRRGRFRFSLIDNPWLSPSPFGYGFMSSCGLRAYMGGLTSPMFSLAGRHARAWPGIGTFRLTRPNGLAGTPVSVTTLTAPKLAKKHFEKALKHLRDARLEKAAEELELAVEEHPEYAAAWALLGEARQQLGYEWGVREAFERSLEADSRYLRPFAPLIRFEVADEDFEQAAELAARAIRLNPLSSELHYYLALSKYGLGDREAARYSARRAVEADDAAENAEAYVLYGNILAEEGDRAEAAKKYRQFLALQPNLKISALVRDRLRSWGESTEAPDTQQAEALK